MKKKQKTGHSSSAFYGIFSLLLCISVLALVLVFANSKGTAATDRTAETFCSVYIEEGDSLWSMASQYAPEGMDGVAAKIAYLTKTAEIAESCTDAASFTEAMNAAFPDYAGANYLEMTAGFLFPAAE